MLSKDRDFGIWKKNKENDNLKWILEKKGTFSLKELREKLGCVNLMYGAKTSCSMLWKVLAKIHVIGDFEVLHNLNWFDQNPFPLW